MQRERDKNEPSKNFIEIPCKTFGDYVQMKILVTGANGFIGKALCKKLRNQQHDVIAAVRRRCNISNVTILENEYSWEKALMNQDIVIHTAGLSQVRKDTEIDPLEVYRSVNVQKTF